MLMLLRISWRNIFRNLRRSLIVAGTIAIGLWGSILSIGIMEGMMQSMVRNTLGMHTAHIAVHRKGFQDTHDIHLVFSISSKLLKSMENNAQVIGYAPRALNSGLASTAESSSGVEIVGVDNELEPRVTTIKESVVDGKYLGDPAKNEIVIGKKLAKKLGVKLKNKVILMAQALDGTIGSGAYRVVGLYETTSPGFDDTMVYISLKNAQKLFSIQDRINEIAIRVKNDKFLENVKKMVQTVFPEQTYEILPWQGIHPLLHLQLKLFDETLYLFFLILVIAMSFTIINTLLMVIFERIHEFGVMRSMGVTSWQLLVMLIMESVYLAIIGLVFGTIITVVFLAYFNVYGLDVSMFSEAAGSVAMSSIIFPEYNLEYFMVCSLGIILIAILSSLYPGWKAIKLEPVEALRYR